MKEIHLIDMRLKDLITRLVLFIAVFSFFAGWIFADLIRNIWLHL